MIFKAKSLIHQLNQMGTYDLIELLKEDNDKIILKIHRCTISNESVRELPTLINYLKQIQSENKKIEIV